MGVINMTVGQFAILCVGFCLGYFVFSLTNACCEVYLFFERKNRQHREKRKAEKENKQ